MIQYDPHEWWAHFLDVRGSMVHEISARVAGSLLWTAVAVALYELGLVGAYPATAHGLVGVALGLLLVFRTNSSYDRFWEGRKQWGSIVNESRNLARAARVWLAADAELARGIVEWTAAFAWATMHSLRGMRGLGPMEKVLAVDEVADAMQRPHLPLAVATRISSLLSEARRRGLVTDILHVDLDGYVRRLVDCLGACERIQTTPMPFAYAVHLRRALIIYAFTLPFALAREFGWGAILATLLVNYTLFGIEEIGVEIENPFGNDDNDLPLETICANLQANLLGGIEPAAVE